MQEALSYEVLTSLEMLLGVEWPDQLVDLF